MKSEYLLYKRTHRSILPHWLHTSRKNMAQAFPQDLDSVKALWLAKWLPFTVIVWCTMPKMKMPNRKGRALSERRHRNPRDRKKNLGAIKPSR